MSKTTATRLFIGSLILPHLTVLLGIGQRRARGQLAPRAVPLFNAMHHPVAPLALLGLAAAATGLPGW